MEGKNSSYGLIDIVKFIFSILIIAAHYISEYADGRVNSRVEMGSSLYIITVPFFFACSGFFLFSKIIAKDGNEYYSEVKKYVARIAIMYMGWSIIYILFQIAVWIRFGIEAGSLFVYILHCFTYSTYKTIWFLPALMVGVLLTALIYKKFGYKMLIIISTVAYFFSVIGVSYSFILSETPIESILSMYNYIFESARNGLFYGFPYVTIGFIVAYKKGYETHSVRNKYCALTFLCGILFVIEAFLIKFLFHAINVNTLITLVPFTYCFLYFVTCIKTRQNNIFVFIRKISTTAFLCQRIFLSAIPELIPEGHWRQLMDGNAYVALCVIICVILAVSALIVWIGEKSKVVSALI